MVQVGGSLVRWHCLQPVAGDKLPVLSWPLCWAQKYLAHLPLFLRLQVFQAAELVVRPPEGHFMGQLLPCAFNLTFGKAADWSGKEPIWLHSQTES